MQNSVIASWNEHANCVSSSQLRGTLIFGQQFYRELRERCMSSFIKEVVIKTKHNLITILTTAIKYIASI